jgi:ATP-binding cassette subfamily B protein
MSLYFRWIWSYWRRRLGVLPILLCFTAVSTAVAVAWPLVWKYALDAARTLAPGHGEAMGRVADAVLILLLVGVGRSVRNFYPMMRARVNGLFEMAVRRDYFEKILHKRHGFFQRFRTGDVVTRLTDDISGFSKIAWFMCSGVFRALESFSGLVFSVVAMLFLDWRLGLITITPLPLMMFIWYRVRVRVEARFKRNQTAISKTNDLLESTFSGIRIVKAYNAEERFRKKLGAILSDRVEVEMDVVKLWALLDTLYATLSNLGRVLAIVFGGLWVLDGSLTIGTLYAIFLYVDQLVRPMMDIPQFFISGKQTTVCIDRLLELADFEAGRRDDDGGPSPVERIEQVALHDVSFRYENGRAEGALAGVTLTVPRGRRVAVVGAVGCGKSTVARILSGELRPASGEVLVNGRPLAEQDLRTYRRHVGYVPQEALLFSDTVRENVAFGRPIDDAAVHEALRTARMDAEVAAFPKGLDELLGRRGVRVSGGQRQRLAIARALAGNPDLLILDDVTAALDAENEEALWDALDSARKDLAAIVVTHRVATAMRADHIVVLDRGRMAGEGTHEHLLATCPPYRRLARSPIP